MRDRRAVAEYARRDWSTPAAATATYWRTWKRRHGGAGGVRIADELRRQVLAVRREWPTPDERLQDLIAHVKVAEALRRVPSRRR